MSVTQIQEYLERKEDRYLDSRMELAQELVAQLLEDVDFDSPTTYFVYRNLSDILLQGMDWEPDMMRGGLEFDIQLAEDAKEKHDGA